MAVMMDGWIASARYLIDQYRHHPEHYRNLTEADRLKLASDLEDCVERYLRFGREERHGMAWWDFERVNEDK